MYHDDWTQLTEDWAVDVERIEDLALAARIAPRSREHFAEATAVGDGFAQQIAERYFEVTSRVMRGHLPHHLNLGTRLTPGFPDAVAKVAGRYVDVMSFNMYTRDLDHFRREVARLHDASTRPVLITEFAFPARENRSGNRNKGYEDGAARDDSRNSDVAEIPISSMAPIYRDCDPGRLAPASRWVYPTSFQVKETNAMACCDNDAHFCCVPARAKVDLSFHPQSALDPDPGGINPPARGGDLHGNSVTPSFR